MTDDSATLAPPLSLADALPMLLGALHTLLEVERGPRPPTDVETLRGQLALDLPARGRPRAEVEERLGALIRATPPVGDGRSYSQLTSGRDWAAVVGDMLVPAMDHTLSTWRAAGPQVWVEQVLVERMCGLIGWPDGEGTFSPGGSLSNLGAMVLARDRAEERASRDGIARPHGLYTSASAHYSVRKAAAVAGMGRGRMQAVPVDSEGRMDPAALRAMLERDRDAGLAATAIVATSGTSVEGAFDPLPALADLADEFGAWLHVDGAWGGSAALVPELRRTVLDGIERADSVTWDAHKAMGVPLGCSLLAVRERGRLAASLDETATYLFGGSDGDNPGRRSLLCGRRNDVLKLWVAWQFLGDEGFADRIRRLRAQAELAAERVRRHPRLTLALEPRWLNVCFRAEGIGAAELCAKLADAGEGVVAHGPVAGEHAVRLVLVDPARPDAEVHRFFDALEAALP